MHAATLPAYQLQFDRARYDIEPGETFTVSIGISPMPENGLYSFGTKLEFPSTNVTVVTNPDVEIESLWDYDGVLGPGAVRATGGGFAAVKGTVDTLAPQLQPGRVGHLASIRCQDSSSTRYPITLSLFNTLGPTEQIFVTGDGEILDERLEFGTALVNHRPQGFFVLPQTNAFLPSGQVRVEAEAWDYDGLITRVEFWEQGSRFATFTNPPFSAILANLSSGPHTIQLRAEDDSGAGLTNFITFLVAGQLSATVLSPLTLDRQTGLFRESVQVVNHEAATLSALVLRVGGLPSDVRLVNAWGITNGTPFVGYNSPLPSGSNVVFVLEYFVADRRSIPPPIYSVETEIVPPPPASGGILVSFVRALRLRDDSFLVEFLSLSGREYVIEYSDDLNQWIPAVPSLSGNGTRRQWIDTGPPKTQFRPAAQRFYRVRQLP